MRTAFSPPASNVVAARRHAPAPLREERLFSQCAARACPRASAPFGASARNGPGRLRRRQRRRHRPPRRRPRVAGRASRDLRQGRYPGPREARDHGDRPRRERTPHLRDHRVCGAAHVPAHRGSRLHRPSRTPPRRRRSHASPRLGRASRPRVTPRHPGSNLGPRCSPTLTAPDQVTCAPRATPASRR